MAYDPNTIPFALEKMEVRLVDPTGHMITSAPAFVFFTPYNTVELWNRADLDNLTRVWDVPNATIVPERQYVDPNQIPVSDLTDAELADESVPKKLRSIPGLAYAIPVKDTGQDTEADDEEPGDVGVGQRGTLARHTWTATVTGRVLTQQWNGRSSDVLAAFPLAVSGIRVELWDKDGLLDDFLASGHTDDDGRFSIAFSNTQGSEGSYLDLYLKIEASTAGGTIRVIQRIGITRNGTNGLSNPTGLHFNTRALNLGDVFPNHDNVKPHLLHYAWQSRRFLDQNGLGNVLPNSQSRPLHIMITPLNQRQSRAFFMPGGYRNPVAGALFAAFGQFGFVGLGIGTVTAAGLAFYLSNEDCLYIGEERETEETAYHEFGHYLMWHMQNRSWANFLEAGFASHSDLRNGSNTKIAWTEGWASGFAMIMDAYTVRYDNEREVDDNGRANENKEPLDRIRRPVDRNGSLTNEFVLTKGYLAEYFISTTLYDLWDGNNNLALRPNSPINATATGAGSPNGGVNAFLAFEDNTFFSNNPFQPRILDEVSLSFADLTAPIRSHPGNGIWGVGQFSPTVIQDMPEYFRYLLQVHEDCEERRLLANVFLINRISDFPDQTGLPTDAPTQRLGTDEIQRTVTMTEPIFTEDDGTYFFDKSETFTVTLDQNELTGPAESYNLAATTPGGTGSLSDPLTVRDGAVLGINSGAERGYGGSGQNVPAGSTFTAALCGRFLLTVARGSRLEVGDATRGTTATAALGDRGLIELQNGSAARVQAGSVLTIQSGATLVVRNGATLTVDGQVRIESGGFICVETGGNLVFATTAELYVDPAATLGTNPALGLNTPGCSGQLAVCGNLTGGHAGVTNTGGLNEALQFSGDDVVTIANTGSYVNTDLSQQFTVEAFIRADDLSINGAQTIFSSRHPSTAPTSYNGFDGILFSLYNGKVLLQLGGQNYFANADVVAPGDPGTRLPNDNGCHHVAVTRDAADRLRFYIDGQERAYSPVIGINAHSDGNLNLGGDLYYGDYREHFRGMIGEVRVWNTWRSAAQIQQNLTAKLAAPQFGLVAYYDMQNAAGSQQLSDLSGVDNTGRSLVPGVLGTTTGPGPDEPAWVTQCTLACTVQGNFRGTALSGADSDSAEVRTSRRVLPKPTTAATAEVAALSVSPNPATQSATLRFEHPQAGSVRVWVQDMLGSERAVVLRETKLGTGAQQLTVPLHGLQPGLYLVVVQSPGGQQHIRLQVN